MERQFVELKQYVNEKSNDSMEAQHSCESVVEPNEVVVEQTNLTNFVNTLNDQYYDITTLQTLYTKHFDSKISIRDLGVKLNGCNMLNKTRRVVNGKRQIVYKRVELIAIN